MRGHIRTDRLDINTALCTGCGSCVEVCQSNALKVHGPKFLNEHHVHAVKSAECTGCLRCVAACPEGAIARAESKGGRHV